MAKKAFPRTSSIRVEQAVVNLIDDAVKYSEPGTAVEIRVDQRPDETAISAKDAGCGIPAEHLSRVFERSYVVDKSRSRKLGGTGPGLAIVKHIAQVHGGYVTVESAPGKGCTFTIHLPRRYYGTIRLPCRPRVPNIDDDSFRSALTGICIDSVVHRAK